MPVSATARARSAATPSRSWLVPMARAGYLAKAVVYVLIGVLAASAALGEGGRTTGAVGALREIANQPYGRVLVGVMALGLACYAAWRWCQAIVDPENKTATGKGKVLRGVYFASAIVHTGLTVTAATMALSGGSSGGSGSQGFVSDLMQDSLGRWAVGIAGVVIFGAGVAEFVTIARGKEKQKLDASRMNHNVSKAADVLIPLGLGARGVVFCAIGVLVAHAAWTYDSSNVGGTDKALGLIQNQDYGQILLLAVAVGLICYGGLCALKGVYRRFRV